MSRFHGSRMGRFHQGSGQAQQSRSMADLRVGSVITGYAEVEQTDPVRSAFVINAAPGGYASNLIVINDMTGARVFSVDNTGAVTSLKAFTWNDGSEISWQISPTGWSQGFAIATPATPPATYGRFYIKTKGTTTGMYFLDDAGGEHELGAVDGSGTVFALTDAATVATDCLKGNIFTLSTNAARTMGAPTNATTGRIISYDMLNNGGSGALTWNAVFQLAGAWTDPANGKRRTITFYSPDGTNFRELSRAAADI